MSLGNLLFIFHTVQNQWFLNHFRSPDPQQHSQFFLFLGHHAFFTIVSIKNTKAKQMNYRFLLTVSQGTTYISSYRPQYFIYVYFCVLMFILCITHHIHLLKYKSLFKASLEFPPWDSHEAKQHCSLPPSSVSGCNFQVSISNNNIYSNSSLINFECSIFFSASNS